MARVLFLVFMILEIGFAVFEFTKDTSKKDWTKKRLIVNAAELAIYLVMMFPNMKSPIQHLSKCHIECRKICH